MVPFSLKTVLMAESLFMWSKENISPKILIKYFCYKSNANHTTVNVGRSGNSVLGFISLCIFLVSVSLPLSLSTNTFGAFLFIIPFYHKHITLFLVCTILPK